LPGDARRVLQEAAVLGAEFEETLLRDVVNDPSAASLALGPLVEADLIQSAGPGRDGARYRFTHALVHEVVYQNLLLARRTELHEKAGRALERAAGPHPERLSDLEALGHHWSLSADKPRGARYLLAAGDKAGAVEWAEGALAEVAREHEATVNSARAREVTAVRAQAYNTLGVALARTGRLTEAVAQIEQSIGLAEACDLLQDACRGYTNLGVLYSSLDPQRSIETCLRGLATAKKVGDLGFQSRLYANLAVAYCALTDRCEAEGVEAARAAIELD